MDKRFEGTDTYVATEDLMVAVNASVGLERPLLVKGEPGTGKTILAHEIAKALDVPLIQWHIKSTTKAQQGLYEYDAVARLRDSQLGDERVHDIRNYIVKGRLWEAFTLDTRPVLLIDEIDKADIEFPNDLLLELDRMEFHVYETKETVVAARRPIVLITSNNEKELPDAFLRRCFFHYIRFPDRDTMERIVDVHYPGIQKRLVHDALTVFYDMREVPGLKKKPSTSELLGLDQAPDDRGHPARSAQGQGRPPADPAALRRAAQERAGRPPVRTPRLHQPPRGPVTTAGGPGHAVRTARRSRSQAALDRRPSRPGPGLPSVEGRGTESRRRLVVADRRLLARRRRQGSAVRRA